MKNILLFSVLLLFFSDLSAQSYDIGDQQNVITCNGTFYDAGGPQGFAGYDYKVTTFHSDSNCLKVSFTNFDLGFGGELRIYKGTSPATGLLVGIYSGTNAPPIIISDYITFEYTPPVFNIGNLPGWTANLQCVPCSQGMVRSDPASDCPGAIPLCANSTVIVSTNQYTDTGALNDDVGSCFSGTGNGGSVWYSFSPQTTGNLDFSIVPSGSTDYDYVLYDASNGCGNLNELSCNFSATYGTTGITTNSSNYTSSYSGCTGSTYYSAPADCGVWNQAVGVTVGHQYMLMVNFYGGSNDGFTLHFQNDPGTVSITDNIPPTFASVTQSGCGGSSIDVTFSENIDCTTLQASDFSLPGYSVAIASTGCVSNMTQAVTLTISPALAPGNYTLQGHTMNDMCGNPLNDTYNFTINPAPNLTTSFICNGSNATLTATGCTGSLQWQEWGQVPSSTPITDAASCTACGGTPITLLGIYISCSVGTSCPTTIPGWVNLGTTSSITVSPPYATQYQAVCTVGTSCTSSSIVVVNCNSPMSATLNSPSICQGGCTNLTPAITGGTAPFTYSWNPATLSGANPNVCPTSNTTYTVTISDAGGNTATASGTVTVGSSLSPTISGATSICTGSSTTLDVGAGYTSYSWSNSNATQTISVTTAGTYTVTVANASGCTGTASVVVTVNSNLSPTITGPSSICSGSTATLDAGSGYTSYLWSTTASTQTIAVTTGGTYTVTVSNASGCSGTSSFAVTVGSNLTINVNPSTPSICPGANISLTASGATTYSWSPGTGLSSTTGATVTANPVTTTNYTVNGSDASGCTGSTTIAVTVNPISATATGTDENCGQSNGTATATCIGTCVSGFTYQWSSIPVQTSQIANNLTAGTYTVTVFCGACSTTANVTINNIAGPSASISGITNASCGFANGSATVTAVGGVAPYSYQWNSSPAQYSSLLSNVIAGVYNVTVTDGNNCTAINTVTISNIPGPTATIASFTNASCGQSDGLANLNVVGGTPPYTFNWNSMPSQATQNLANVPTGTYNVTVTDANGCASTASVTVGQNAGPSATASSTNELCDQSNGTATVNANGGTGTYTYLWNNGQTTSTATGLQAGTYTVTVNDGFCTGTTSVMVTNIPGPTAGFSAHPNVVTSMDGPVSFLDNSSGTVVSWNWMFGDGSPNGSGDHTDHQFTNIGTYLVTLIVTDNNGCMDTVTDTIKVKEIFTLYIPNAFSPNGDGKNDFFTPQGLSVDPDNFSMTIFDRWGNIMFQTTKWLGVSAEAWNGTEDNKGSSEDAVMGVYVYRIRLKELDGPKHEYIGKIILIP